MNTPIQPGDTVLLRCAMRANGEDVISNLDAAAPEELTLGDGALPPPLERCVVGLAPGVRRIFTLPPAEAFGERDPELVRAVERAKMPPGETLRPDTMIEFAFEDGTPLPGVVIEVTPDSVVVDFNHPLSGMVIEFEVEVVATIDQGSPT